MPASVTAAASGRMYSIETARASIPGNFASQQPPWTTITTGNGPAPAGRRSSPNCRASGPYESRMLSRTVSFARSSDRRACAKRTQPKRSRNGTTCKRFIISVLQDAPSRHAALVLHVGRFQRIGKSSACSGRQREQRALVDDEPIGAVRQAHPPGRRRQPTLESDAGGEAGEKET